VNWASMAVLSAAIMGMVSVLDSHLLSRRMPSLRALLLPAGVLHLCYGLVTLAIFPLPAGVGIWPVLAAAASGILRTIAVILMFNILTREEVSRVVPVVYTYPVLVAIMAVPLLGETLGYLQWLAILVVVAGAVIISAEKRPPRVTGSVGRPFLLLFVSSLCIALGDVASKYALNTISFWNGFSLAAICMSVIFLLFSLRPEVLRSLRDMPRRNSSLGLLLFNESIAPVGIVCVFWAIKQGPVSLVSTIVGSRPIFVAVYSLILGRFLPDFLIKSTGKGVLIVRLVATAMIVSGIAIIYLV